MTNSIQTILWMLAVGVVLAACAGPPAGTSASADLGGDLGSSHVDLAKWGAGPDNTSP